MSKGMAPVTKGDGGSIADAIIHETNQLRGQHGKRPLQKHDKLTKAAQRRAVAQARSGGISHNGWLKALRAIGWNRGAGENLAYGQDGAVEVVEAWADSPGHRANMLAGDFRYIGVGVASNGRQLFYCQLFGGK